MRNRLLPFGLILLLAGLLTLVLQDFTRRVIATPLLYVFWIGRLLLESIPQIGFWWLFLFIALAVAGRSLLKHKPAPQPTRRAEKAGRGRIETWAKLIIESKQETYYKWQLAQHLQELTLAVLAHDERLTPKQIKQRLLDNQLDMPPEIQAYLQAGMTSFSHLLGPRPRFGSKAQPSPLDLDPEQIIQFLEEKFDYRTD